MPAPSPQRPPTPTRYAPQWRALGVSRPRREDRYWLEINGEAREFRGAELCGLAFLASIYPDMSYWRAHFPLGRGHGVDTRAAMSYFIQQCVRAGKYTPSVKSAP